MPSIHLKLLAALSVLALSACETTTAPATAGKPMSSVESVASAGLTQDMANQEMIAAAVPRALAESYARECAQDGISLREPNRSVVMGSVEQRMLDKGYTPRMVEIAESNMDRHADSIARALLKDLMAKGVKRGDVATFCNLGKREIAGGTAIGKQLKLG